MVKIKIIHDPPNFDFKDCKEVDILILIGGGGYLSFIDNFLNENENEYSHNENSTEIIVICSTEEYDNKLGWVHVHSSFSNISNRVHFLHKESVTIKGVEFIGCTLWANKLKHYKVYKILQNFQSSESEESESEIRLHKSLLKVWHKNHKIWLEKNVNENSVVLTHFKPTQQLQKKIKNYKLWLFSKGYKGDGLIEIDIL